MTDRLHCINPRCRRTASVEKHPHSSEIVCAKCWKLLPRRLTRRYRTLSARDRKLDRRVQRVLVGKGFRPRQIFTMRGQLDRLMDANWSSIRAFFHPTEKPEGLEAFLEEFR